MFENRGPLPLVPSVSDTTNARLAPATTSEWVLEDDIPPSMQIRSPTHVGLKIPGSDMLADTAWVTSILVSSDTTSRSPV